MVEINSNDVIIFTIFGLATIALLFGFILYFVFGYRSKQRDNQVLESQKEEIAHQKQVIENTLSELKATQNQLILSEKLASLGELTAGIAHEIQNPLNFVNNFSELSVELLDELKQEYTERAPPLGVSGLLNNISENLQKISLHGQRASSIVKSMLQHSRKSSGQLEPTDINQKAVEYLRLAFHGLRAQNTQNTNNKAFNTKIETDFDPKIMPINLMAQDIGRVFLNIFTNAFQAVFEKSQKIENFDGLVKVVTKNLVGTIEIHITDNGFGIPNENINKIFQPFFTTKPTGQGTGLGLSLAYDIIKAHNGQLSVKSQEGESTEFIISLPK